MAFENIVVSKYKGTHILHLRSLYFIFHNYFQLFIAIASVLNLLENNFDGLKYIISLKKLTISFSSMSTPKLTSIIYTIQFSYQIELKNFFF